MEHNLLYSWETNILVLFGYILDFDIMKHIKCKTCLLTCTEMCNMEQIYLSISLSSSELFLPIGIIFSRFCSIPRTVWTQRLSIRVSNMAVRRLYLRCRLYRCLFCLTYNWIVYSELTNSKWRSKLVFSECLITTVSEIVQPWRRPGYIPLIERVVS